MHPPTSFSSDYIAAVCNANRLEDTLDWMIQSSEDIYSADRHVESPPANIPARAACAAGLALLEQWTKELPKVRASGLFASIPRLVIDQEWLDESEDAPPPHVMLTIAKRQMMLPKIDVSGDPIDGLNCPLSDLLIGSFEFVKASRFEGSAERGSLGGWIFEFEELKSNSLDK